MDRSEDLLSRLDAVLAARRGSDPHESYVASLYAKGLNKILEKVGEEATEVIIAAKDHRQGKGEGEGDEDLINEVADLWFHTLVLLQERGLSSAQVLQVLEQRFGLSGHAEKAARAPEQ